MSRLPSPFRSPPRIGAAAVACLAPFAASAQEVSKAAEKSEWLSLVVGVLLVAFVCVGAFMGSKRGHMD